ERRSLAPDETLGHPPEPALWVRGRALSRYRSGTRVRGRDGEDHEPEIHGRSLLLPVDAALEFAPIDLPLDRTGEPYDFDVLVTITRSDIEAGATLRVLDGDRLIGELELPPARVGTWIGPPLRWMPSADRASLRVELRGPGESVELRDIALFARMSGYASVLGDG
ncbi:MAG: hypothetical protein KC431_23480, partial [Myxococcales bacterium]|nr:hypothetical protein [Myxococcales bacterium]